MEIISRTVRSSPYIGVFSLVTEEIGLFPHQVSEKEVDGLGELFGIEMVRASLANSGLLGVFAAALGKQVVVPAIAEPKEIEFLGKKGMEVKQIDELTALGNLVLMNSKGGIASRLMKKENVKALGRFFGVEFRQESIAGSDLPGASAVVTESGFIVSPRANNAEFKMMEKVFGVGGAMTTANYGDAFVGNTVLANSKAAVVGIHTTGHELIRIDEGLRGG